MKLFIYRDRSQTPNAVVRNETQLKSTRYLHTFAEIVRRQTLWCSSSRHNVSCRQEQGPWPMRHLDTNCRSHERQGRRFRSLFTIAISASLSPSSIERAQVDEFLPNRSGVGYHVFIVSQLRLIFIGNVILSSKLLFDLFNNTIVHGNKLA